MNDVTLSEASKGLICLMNSDKSEFKPEFRGAVISYLQCWAEMAEFSFEVGDFDRIRQEVKRQRELLQGLKDRNGIEIPEADQIIDDVENTIVSN